MQVKIDKDELENLFAAKTLAKETNAASRPDRRGESVIDLVRTRRRKERTRH